MEFNLDNLQDRAILTQIATGGGGATYPDVLDDGNTVAWYDSDESYMTKDGSDIVSQWDDRSGNTNHLTGAGSVWSADGVLFDGVNDYLRKNFTLVQPEFIYAVLKQVTWTSNDRIWDGWGTDGGALSQSVSTSNLYMIAPSLSPGVVDAPLNTFFIVRTLFNGASSKLIINEDAPATGNSGVNNMGGITLGVRGGLGSQFSNIQVKEVVIRKTADGASDEASIYDYLKNKYGL